MKKYIATPSAEVIGSAMQNFFVSLNQDEFIALVQNTLKKYGVDEIAKDKWYPHQLSLDVFKLISQQKSNSMNNLVALGLAYVETATFPPEINSIPSAMLALSLTYGLNIRNIAPGEGYEVTQVANNHIQIKDFNPFPHDTVYGFIWGISKRFANEGLPVVVRTYFNPTEPDEDGALYDVTW